ncbi:MAG TPA: pyridoxamine 5'-phosphate oxidase family protein [Balneolaceae bacterium]
MIITGNIEPQNVLTKTHRELKKGSSDSRHPFRYSSLATHNPETNEPNVRMVILREVAEDWSTIIYTDARSAKVEEIKQLGRAALLFWHSHHKVQLTMKVNVKLHQNDETAEQFWSKDVHGPARKAYTPLTAPGTVVPSPEKAHDWPEEFSMEHFCVLECVPFDIQVLQINRKEHRRLRFQRNEESELWEGQWIAP